MEVTLYDVEIMTLREKITAWEILFGRTAHVSVSGTFEAKNGEMAFFNRRLYKLDHKETYRRWLSLCVDGQWEKFRPVNDVIAVVKFSK